MYGPEHAALEVSPPDVHPQGGGGGGGGGGLAAARAAAGLGHQARDVVGQDLAHAEKGPTQLTFLTLLPCNKTFC